MFKLTPNLVIQRLTENYKTFSATQFMSPANIAWLVNNVQNFPIELYPRYDCKLSQVAALVLWNRICKRPNHSFVIQHGDEINKHVSTFNENEEAIFFIFSEGRYKVFLYKPEILYN